MGGKLLGLPHKRNLGGAANAAGELTVNLWGKVNGCCNCSNFWPSPLAVKWGFFYEPLHLNNLRCLLPAVGAGAGSLLSLPADLDKRCWVTLL